MTHLLVATRNAHKVAEMAAILGPGYPCRSLQEFPGAPLVVEDAPDFAGNALKKAKVIATWLADRSPGTGPPLPPPAFVLADDSGLEVDALGGAPGVHSARFAALDAAEVQLRQNSSDEANNGKLLRLLAGFPPGKRTARFRCVLALVSLPGSEAPHSELSAVSGVPPSPGAEMDKPATGSGSSIVCRHSEQAAAGDGRTPPIAHAKLFEGVCEGRIAQTPSGHGGFGYDPLFIPDRQDCSFAQLGEDVKNRISHRARALAQLRAWLGRE